MTNFAILNVIPFYNPDKILTCEQQSNVNQGITSFDLNVLE